jgi:hypothetical protein
VCRRVAIQSSRVNKEIDSCPKLTPAVNNGSQDDGLCHVSDVGAGELSVRSGVVVEEFLIACLYPLSIPWILFRWGSVGMISREYSPSNPQHRPRAIFQFVLGISMLSIPLLDAFYATPTITTIIFSAM